jgi:peptidyl-tRNA hydrolase, PTH1 family
MSIRLIVGLGNPGRQYEKTRHNAGFLVLDTLAQDYSIDIKQKKFNAEFGRGLLDGQTVFLAKPQGYMNRSGPPIQQLATYFKIPTNDILIIHDDIDLTFGRLKLKQNGGHGGHNGLKSIIMALGTDDFIRLRIGIGRSAHTDESDQVTQHVLGSFSQDEKQAFEQIVQCAGKAIVTVIKYGIVEGMNQFNVKSQ